jgi:hypothetical protein
MDQIEIEFDRLAEALRELDDAHQRLAALYAPSLAAQLSAQVEARGEEACRSTMEDARNFGHAVAYVNNHVALLQEAHAGRMAALAAIERERSLFVEDALDDARRQGLDKRQAIERMIDVDPFEADDASLWLGAALLRDTRRALFCAGRLQ